MGFYIEFEEQLDKDFSKLCIDLNTNKTARIMLLVAKDVDNHKRNQVEVV